MMAAKSLVYFAQRFRPLSPGLALPVENETLTAYAATRVGICINALA
jgi:hypothetical protein